MCVCAFDGFLLWVRIAYACPTIASLCNNREKSPTNESGIVTEAICPSRCVVSQLPTGQRPCSAGASVVAVGAALLLFLSSVSGCSLMPLFGCSQGCWVPCVLLCLFPPPPCAWGVSCRHRLLGALFVCSRSCVVGPRSWAGSPSWSGHFGVSCCCLHCYTCSPYCVSL